MHLSWSKETRISGLATVIRIPHLRLQHPHVGIDDTVGGERIVSRLFSGPQTLLWRCQVKNRKGLVFLSDVS